MKLYALIILSQSSNIIYKNYNLEDFSFIYRPTIKNKIETLAKEITKNVQSNSYYIIMEKYDKLEFKIYGNTYDNYYIVITDNDYPQNIVFQLFNTIKNTRICDDNFDTLFVTYKHSINVDKMAQINNDIDETKIILLDSIEKLLMREENLNDLIVKTEDLSNKSLHFKKKAEDLNNCCNII